MRRIVFHTQITLDGRIAGGDGELWDPFPWGEPEIRYVNELFRAADTWVLGRRMYDVIVPWWSAVAAGNPPAEAGELDIAVFSRTLAADGTHTVLGGDPVEELAALKRADGRDIMLSCGPALLAPLAAQRGLIDEYLLAVSPIVLSSGKRVFDDVRQDLPLRLAGFKAFDAGAVVLRYEPAAGA